ncbi:hypothetical protein DPEC_G00188280 [Dallia pectoralis]|uniref:Uncharacterized protein n=1 Tax=Dallia pectoralis TaxID=75939 RepID=A0ACC2GBN6_DALPE|nr:hypothetical protein DPEC_G00188280 [Dallia pectoralis]
MKDAVDDEGVRGSDDKDERSGMGSGGRTRGRSEEGPGGMKRRVVRRKGRRRVGGRMKGDLAGEGAVWRRREGLRRFKGKRRLPWLAVICRGGH